MKLAKEQIRVGVSDNWDKPYNVRRPMFESLSKIKYHGRQAPEYSFEEIRREFYGENKKVVNPYEVDVTFDEMVVKDAKETEGTEVRDVASASSNQMDRSEFNGLMTNTRGQTSDYQDNQKGLTAKESQS